VLVLAVLVVVMIELSSMMVSFTPSPINISYTCHRNFCFTLYQMRALLLALEQQHSISSNKVAKFLIEGENLTVSSSAALATPHRSQTSSPRP
jgi:hypothetical protein